MPLTGPQIGRIHKAILVAYDREELERVLLTCMDIEFDHVVARTDFSAQIFALVRWANQRERALELLKYAHEENPTNAALTALHAEAQTWGAPGPQLPPVAPPPPPGPHPIFLSYSHKDGAIKDRLLADLAAAGLGTWTDDGLEPGTHEWQRAIKEAIRACRCMVVILSPAAEQSEWVNIEIGYARTLQRRIFPVLARGDQGDAVPIALFTTQYVDLRADYAGQVQGQLLPALRKHLGVAAAPDLVTPEAPPPLPPKAYRTDIEPPKPTKPQPPKLQSPIDFGWVPISAGEFRMGSDKARDKQADDDELPQHRIMLPAYRIARVPVTNAQYAAFVRATGEHAPEHWKGGKFPQGEEQHPVVNVSWHDARSFCTWASNVTGAIVRLPSEAEWEKAARGADGRIWPWPDQPPTAELCNFDDNVRDTTPVGAYPRGASPYGVLDMAGNVWEWTGSLFRPYPYDAADGREDPRAEGDRTLRGGSFGSYDNYVRCANRFWFSPGYGVSYSGFRVLSPGF